jgi:serine/threonine protein kinase
MTHSASPRDVPNQNKPDQPGIGSPFETPFPDSNDPTLPPGSDTPKPLTDSQDSGDPSDSATFVSRAIWQGAHLPDLELLGELGRGAMGVVYKARQKSLDRLVAVKMLLHEFCQNEVALARFHSEARTAANLKHPNIVGIHQVGYSAMGPFFVMEYIDGQTLEQTLKKRKPGKPVPVASAVTLMIPVAEAVAYGHSVGVIHRDLKPGNIMIDEFKRPIVLDFGIAKVAGGQKNLTGQGVVMGTPAYIPPEQLHNDVGTVGPYSDVYALGAILYRLLTNKRVFEAETLQRTIRRVLSPELPKAVRKLRPDVPVELEQICMKCLNKNPAERFADAGGLAHELRALCSQPRQSLSGTHLAPLHCSLVSAETGKAFTLKGGLNVIGRAAECEIVLKSREVSKRHCQLLVRDDGVTLEDLGSINGTIINGQTIRRGVLKDGDVLDIGDRRLTFRLHPRSR